MKLSTKVISTIMVVALLASTLMISGMFAASAEDKVLIDFNTEGTYSTTGHQDNLSTDGSAKVTRVATADEGCFNSGNSLKVTYPAGETQAWRWTTISVSNIITSGLVANATGIKFWAKAEAGRPVTLSEVGISNKTDGVSKKKTDVTITDVGTWYELPFSTLGIASTDDVSTYKYFSFRVLLNVVTGKTFYLDDITLYGITEGSATTTVAGPTTTTTTVTNPTTTTVTNPTTTTVTNPTTTTVTNPTTTTTVTNPTTTTTVTNPTTTTTVTNPTTTTIVDPTTTTEATEEPTDPIELSPEMQAFIDALSAIMQMDFESDTFTDEQLAAMQAFVDAYDALSDEEKQELNIDNLSEIFDMIATIITPANSTTTTTTTTTAATEGNPDTNGAAPIGIVILAIAAAGVLAGTKKRK